MKASYDSAGTSKPLTPKNLLTRERPATRRSRGRAPSRPNASGGAAPARDAARSCAYSALKVLYPVATQQRNSRQDMTGKINGWKTILNTQTVHYGDRIAANTIS